MIIKNGFVYDLQKPVAGIKHSCIYASFFLNRIFRESIHDE